MKDIICASHPIDEDGIEPSLLSSYCRAAHSLEKRGLVQTTIFHDGLYRKRSDPDARLAVWMSTQEPPLSIAPDGKVRHTPDYPHGEELQNIIVQFLHSLTREQVEEAERYYSAPIPKQHDNQAPYGYVSRRILEGYCRNHYDVTRCYVSIHRAVRKLEEKGVITTVRGRKCYYIGLRFHGNT